MPPTDHGIQQFHGRLLLRVSEVAKMLGMGRSKVYEMAAAGELPTVRIGTAVRVPYRQLLAWIERQTEKAAA